MAENELNLDFDLDQFDLSERSQESEDSEQYQRQIQQQLLSQSAFDADLLLKDLVQLSDTHVLGNTQELQSFRPFSIQKVATANQTTLVGIKQQVKVTNIQGQMPLKLLYYNLNFRTSDYQKFYQPVSIPNRQSAQDDDIRDIYLSQSGSFAIVLLQSGYIYIYNFYHTKSSGLKYSALHVTRDSTFDHTKHHVTAVCMKELSQTCLEVLFGTRDAQVFTFRVLKKDKRLAIDCYGSKPYLVHAVPEFSPVLSLDYVSFIISDQRILKLMQDELGVGSSNAFMKQSISSPVGDNTEGQLNYKVPNNLLQYQTNTDYKRFLVMVATEAGLNIIEGRGCSVGDVLLLSNSKEQIDLSGGQVRIAADKYPRDYRYVTEIPSSVRLPMQRPGFFTHNQVGQPTGFAWFSGVRHQLVERELRDIAYDEAGEDDGAGDGWELIGEEEVDYKRVVELHTRQTKRECIAVQCLVNRFGADMQRVVDDTFNYDVLKAVGEDGRESLGAKTVLLAEENYHSSVLQQCYQSEAIIDPQTIRPAMPTSVQYNLHSYLVSYDGEFVVINQVTKMCCQKVGATELITGLVRSGDADINFKGHTDIADRPPPCLFASDEGFKFIYAYSAQDIYQLYFNDKKELYRDYMQKRQFDQAYELASTVQQIQEIKYYQAHNSIDSRQYVQAARQFATTPLEYETVFMEFCRNEPQIGFQHVTAQQYIHREAVITYLMGRLGAMDIKAIRANYLRSSAIIRRKVNELTGSKYQNVVSQLNQQDVKNVCLFKEVIFAIFMIIFNYLSLINDTYFQSIINIQLYTENYDIGQLRQAQFQIINQSKCRAMNDLQIKFDNIFNLNYNKQQLRQVPKYNRQLTDFIKQYSEILPISISRQLLNLSNNHQAFEAFNIAIKDQQQLMQFYCNQIVILKNIEEIKRAIEEKVREAEEIEKQKAEKENAEEQADVQEQQAQQVCVQPHVQGHSYQYGSGDWQMGYYSQYSGYTYQQLQEQLEYFQPKTFVNHYQNNYKYFSQILAFESNYDYLIEKIFEVIGQAESPQILYNYAIILFRYEPEKACKSFIDYCQLNKDSVEPLQFLPLFLQTLQKSVSPLTRHCVAKFLFQSMSNCQWQQTGIQNLLIQILCNNIIENPEDTEFRNYLYTYMQLQKEQQSYDFSYALRLVSQSDCLYQAKCYLLFSNQYLQHAIQCCIDNDDFALAKQLAYQVEDEQVMHSLLLGAAQKYYQKLEGEYALEQQFGETKTSQNPVIQTLKFFNQSRQIIRIEELLVMKQTSNINITQQLKQEIKYSMSNYQMLTEQYKQQTEQSTQSSQQISKDLKSLRQRYNYVRKRQVCQFCNKALLRGFQDNGHSVVLFSCCHGFHTGCICQVLKSQALADTSQKNQQLAEVEKIISLLENDGTAEQLVSMNVERVVGNECPYCRVCDCDAELQRQYLQVNEDEWKLTLDE